MPEGLRQIPRADSDVISEKDLDAEEEDFYLALESLERHNPGARTLVERWEREYIDVLEKKQDVHAFFVRFAQFKANRKEALRSIEVSDGVEPEVAEKISAFDQDVAHAFGKDDLFLGNGGTAEVYALPNHDGICVKYITNQERYNEDNHLRVEFRYLDALSGLSVGRARLPRPYFLRIHPTEGHSYGMERVHGKSLSRLASHPQEAPDVIAAAKSLDRNAALAELVELVKLLHVHGVTHRDLKMRNIMLDTKGNFFIIDFGKAKREEAGEDHELYRKMDLSNLVGEFKQFYEKLDSIDIG